MSFARADRHRGSTGGFTLIEVLISILLFGIIAAVCYQGLAAVINARERVSAENRKWRSIALAFTRLELDLAAIVDRPVHGPAGTMQASSLIGNPSYLPQEATLMFSREGEPDASGNPGIPVRTGYRLREGSLEVLTWPVLDAAPSVQALATPLLDGVAQLELAYLTADGQQGVVWPLGLTVAPGGFTAPAGVSVRLTLRDGTQVSRLFALGAPGIR